MKSSLKKVLEAEAEVGGTVVDVAEAHTAAAAAAAVEQVLKEEQKE